MEQTKLTSLRSLSSLDYIFEVMPYQRGYRWTTKQVKDFLEDLKAFSESHPDPGTTGTFYFLQALVVKKIGVVDGREHWELIDGQQRLTTAFLIGVILDGIFPGSISLPYAIEYKSRPNSANFLESLKTNLSNSNEARKYPDFWYMSKAAEYIRSWLNDLKQFDPDKNMALVRLGSLLANMSRCSGMNQIPVMLPRILSDSIMAVSPLQKRSFAARCS